MEKKVSECAECVLDLFDMIDSCVIEHACNQWQIESKLSELEPNYFKITTCSV